jgi:para-aminobenzoate synthetase/4-amino-4-deoxychorismate lyase
VRADSPAEIGGAFAAIESELRAGRHAAGYFSYELGYAFEQRLIPLLPSERNAPLLWFGIFSSCEDTIGTEHEPLPRTHAGQLREEWDFLHYAAAFERIHELTAAGDLYLANLTYRSRFRFAGDPLALYRELRAAARAPHSAFVDDGERQILSLSPELFFEISRDGVVRARPMKGTAARGQSAEEDAAARARLAASEKERSENLMIVDLLRNDFARIARPGSVVVEKLFEVETYPTVHQMVSTVAAKLLPGLGVETFVRALFPCGSVTGAPKIRAIEVIREVEASPRGVYCGAIGRFAPDGSASFNVAIRTLTICGASGEVGVGGAIVYDSQASAEHAECRLKARFYETVRRPLALIETLRFEPGEGFVRGERHLARMAASAGELGLPFDPARIRSALDHAVAAHERTLRVRLVLHEDGTTKTEATPFVASSHPWRFALSPKPIWSRDPLLRHKTDRREHFEHERARLPADCDEVLFTNERGELTEGSRTNIFLEFGGDLVTPNLECGLLDGCLRREMFEEKHCRGASLTASDLARADRIFLGNSLRGLMPALPT